MSKPRFGIVLPQHESSKEQLLGAARFAEESGLDSVWVADHVWGRPDPERPILEGWTALSAVAAVTERVALGPFVARVTLRRPRVTAAMAETLEKIAPGRTVIGLGIGDSTIRAEQAAYDLPFPTKRERLVLLDQTIAAVREVTPKSSIWLGGTSKSLIDRAPEVDGFNIWVEPDEFAPLVETLKERKLSKNFEISWAGSSMPATESIRTLVASGADHIIVTVGAGDYKERVARLADERGRML
jgi:alkanesulfonate monooxygenase SsuD/methylene tetrahydromethanopterin reductase-like flavin-dependent oxidoreductase (luciferase family)